MKKKILLIALPALMALSGCSGLSNKQIEKPENEFTSTIVEDNLAHDEIFGAALANGPAIRKAQVVETADNYKIGYQIKFDDKGNADASDDVLSIRFVAAIKASYSTMVWSRGVTSGNGGSAIGFGNEKYGSTDKLASTVIYDTLSNGLGGTIRAGYDDYVGYTGFIVYTMTGIRYNAYQDSYVGAMLTLHPAEGSDVVSRIYAIKVEKNGAGTASADTFSFSNDKNGFFLAGTINGRVRTVNADGQLKGDNAAVFDTDFAVNDRFLVVQKEGGLFKIWDSRCITTDGANHTSTFFADDGGRLKVISGGDLRLYLNGSNELWSDAQSPYAREDKNLYVRGTVTANGEDDWTAKATYQFKSDRKDYAVLFHVYLSEGYFKIATSDWSGEQYNYITGGNKDGNFVDGGEGNAQCLTSGYYDIYLNNDNPRGVYIFVSE